jgi:hypothetical protein
MAEDTTARDALERSIQRRAMLCDHDELKALDRVLVVLEKVRHRAELGPLVQLPSHTFTHGADGPGRLIIDDLLRICEHGRSPNACSRCHRAELLTLGAGVPDIVEMNADAEEKLDRERADARKKWARTTTYGGQG